MDILEDCPEAGIPLEKVVGVRSVRVPKFPYRIYYRINHNELEIIALSVYHSKQDLDKLLPKLKKRLSK